MTGKGSTISVSGLKITALLTMLTDHVGATVVKGCIASMGYSAFLASSDNIFEMRLPGETAGVLIILLYYLLRAVGRLSFPLFCFLIAEGFVHTHSRPRYLIRLLLAAVISEIPFDLALYGSVCEFSKQNVLLTLALGLLAVWGISALEKCSFTDTVRVLLKQLAYLCTGALIWLGVIESEITEYLIYEYGGRELLYRHFAVSGGEVSLPSALYFCGMAGAGVLTLIVFNIAAFADRNTREDNRILLLIPVFPAALAACLLHSDYAGFGVMAIAVMYIFRDDRQKAMFAALFVLLLQSTGAGYAFADLFIIRAYNGRRGRRPALKYAAYAFYPVHFLVLYGLCRLLRLM